VDRHVVDADRGLECLHSRGLPVWRLVEMRDALDMPATVLPNSPMYDHAPALMRSLVTHASTAKAKATRPKPETPR